MDPVAGQNRTEVSIRAARTGDLPAVVRIEGASFPQPWPQEAFEHYLGRPGFLVAMDRTAAITVVGFVVADTSFRDGVRVGHLKDLAVHPEHRGHGIGHSLVDRALDRLEAVIDAPVYLEVRAGNRPARRLYRRFGFEPTARQSEYYRDGDDAVVMVRDRTDQVGTEGQ